MDSCGLCKFYDREKVECQRYPPVIIFNPEESESILESYYPTVEEDNWCGEFKETIDASD